MNYEVSKFAIVLFILFVLFIRLILILHFGFVFEIIIIISITNDNFSMNHNNYLPSLLQFDDNEMDGFL